MVASNSEPHVLDVRGDYACFSRPELAVERYSYPCPTPAAARGIFESIYFKPQFYWQITKIELLSLPSYIPLRRNEVKDKISETLVKKWIKGTSEPSPLFADLVGTDHKGRTQRQTMALRSPHYRLHAEIVPREGTASPKKTFDSQFIRRAKQGKCFQQPYLGCREFVSFFRLVTDLSDEPAPCDLTQDLGFMIYDVFDLTADNHVAFREDCKSVQPSVSVFAACIENGVLEIPPMDSEKVLRANMEM